MRSKKAIINIITSVVLQILSIICGFIVPRLIISTYGSNVNGLISSITQFLAYITLLESGFGPVIKSILFKPIANRRKDEIQQILRTSQNFFRKIAYVFVIYIFILCFILPKMLSNQFDSIFTLSLVIIISISTFTEYYFGMAYRIYLQAEQKKYIISLIQIGTLILNTIIVVILVYLKVEIHIVKLASCFIFILRPIIQNIYVRKKYNISLKNIKGNYPIKQKWDGLAQHIAYVVHENTDVVILTLCTNMLEVSVYSVYLLVLKGVKSTIQSITGGIDSAFGDMIAKGEKENLNKNFKIYEEFYFTISIIVFSVTLFLIVPFVIIYTRGINDANYIRPIFAYLMVIAEFIWAIRQPYNDLVKVAGHFKETRIGAWVEAISNILISFILVWKFGLIGVAIGTLFAMFIRTIEFMYHVSKYILNRSVWYTFKRLIVITIEIVIIAIIVNIIPFAEVTGYFEWIIQALIVFTISAIVVIAINLIIYRDNVNNIIQKIKNLKNKNTEN